MAMKMGSIWALVALFGLVQAEETQLRGQSEPSEQEGSSMSKFYAWATQKEAAPASYPSAAEYMTNEASQLGTSVDKIGADCNVAQLLATEPAQAPRYSAECYTFTGGTCLTSKCDAERKSVCELGKCICGAGCGGADGVCYEESNKLIARDFTLTNVYWPKYKMYFKRATTFGQMDTTKAPEWSNLGQDKFTLYQLPGLLNNETKYFLGSEKWDEYVLAVRPTTGTALSPFAAYAVKLRDQTVPWNPRDVMLTVCSLKKRGYPNAIMIGSAGSTGKPVWAYIHSLSSYVYGSVTSPGSGGYWNVDPPLEEGTLADCDA